jgi:hypothetical protein
VDRFFANLLALGTNRLPSSNIRKVVRRMYRAIGAVCAVELPGSRSNRSGNRAGGVLIIYLDQVLGYSGEKGVEFLLFRVQKDLWITITSANAF